jgi:hypothetical protein
LLVPRNIEAISEDIKVIYLKMVVSRINIRKSFDRLSDMAVEGVGGCTEVFDWTFREAWGSENL